MRGREPANWHLDRESGLQRALVSGKQHQIAVIRVLLFALVCVGFSAFAQAQNCFSCGDYIRNVIYTKRDGVTSDERKFCEPCTKLTTWCYLCGLPAKNETLNLPDGRVLCARDKKEVVVDEAEAKVACGDARRELARLFSRFLTFPETNVVISIVDRVHMDQLVQTAGFERQCPSIFGYIRSRVVRDGAWQHPISILGALPRSRLAATFAHELGHAWVKENVKSDRDIDQDAVEGFCELVAYKLMVYLNDEGGKKVIRNNKYTRGQIDLFIEADAQYDFYIVMEWMRSGIDQRLQEEDLDRVRKVAFKPQTSPSSQVVVRLPDPVPTPVPDTLTFIGISGSGKRRLALINDRAFAEFETGKVRVGTNNVTVRCLEIRTNTVVIQVEGSEEKQELLLRGK